MANVDVEEGHTPLEIVHCKILLVAVEIAVAVLFGVLLEVMLAAPLNTLQLPTPIVGVFAASIVVLELAHNVCEGPAFATVGIGSTCIAIVEVEAGHTPLEIVHCKMLLVAVEIDEAVAVGEVLGVTAAEPAITLQVPTPTAGVLPVKTKVFAFAQRVCDVPALAIVGGKSRNTVTVDDEGGQLPLVMVQTY